MTLYLVSKPSQEKAKDGTLVKAYTRVFGVFTTQIRAEAIAGKHDATVHEFVADEEKLVTVTEWLNPGFCEGG